MVTNVPKLRFTDRGVTTPQEVDILSGVQADQSTAFGGDVNSQLTSPQGQLAQSQAAIVGAKNDEILAVVNNMNPDIASGRWQDAIGRIYFIDRIPGKATVVTGRCVGLIGTVLPAGTAAQDVNGYVYYSTARAVIDRAGRADVEFQCAEIGPIPCPVGNLSKIYVKVDGWDSITNPTAGSIGSDVESRADFEARRRASVAINATGSPQSIKANVLAVEDVIDAYVIDNPSGSPITVGVTNVDLAPHSVYVCVSGGNEQAIGKAIWEHKSLGCDYNGDQTVIVYDMEGYNEPYPSYEVRYQIAQAAPTYFSVQIANNGRIPADIDDIVRQAIIRAFNGDDGGERARIGSTMYAGRFYAPVFSVSPDINIQSITLGLDETASQTAITYGIDQRPTLDASNITVDLV